MTWPNVHAPGRDRGIAATGRRPSPAGPAGPVTVHYGTTAHTFRISRDLELVKATSGSHRKAQHSLRVEVTVDDTRRRPTCDQLVNLTLTRLAGRVTWRDTSHMAAGLGPAPICPPVESGQRYCDTPQALL